MKKISLGLLLSLLAHAGLYGGVMAYMAYEAKHTDAVEIDLTGASLIRKVNNPGGTHTPDAAPPEPWILGDGHTAPPPKAPAVKPALQTESDNVPCPAPCPANSNDWTPASATSEKPRWTSNFLTSDDYPKEARQQGRSGMVVVIALIDALGHVRDVQVVESSSPAFNDVVINKLKAATFRPAYDQAGNPVPCRFKMPIKFDLQ